jgi:hypothetical protein
MADPPPLAAFELDFAATVAKQRVPLKPNSVAGIEDFDNFAV